MLVPAMQRQKHDALNAKQEDIRLGLAKVDPLDVHQDEAIKLKSEIESEIDKNATTLATSGVEDPNVSAKIIALNRKYNNLISPTGKIGQINAAKQVYAENFKNYMEDATKNKKWSRETALRNWQQNHHSKYTGYDENSNIMNIGDYGSPEKIETMTELKKIKDKIGRAHV